MLRDNLGNRMKENYENTFKAKLMRRTPVAIRIDGKAFHSFTRGFEKPFDKIFMASMQETMKYLCENIQGAKLGYCQSDEITIILTDYDTLTTDAWFGYEVQKMCSIAASMATMAFNYAFMGQWEEYNRWCYESGRATSVEKDLCELYRRKLFKAMFDARCFNIPKEEVANLIYWRQQDATRNSILSVAQSLYPHKQIEGIKCKALQDKMLIEKNVNWNDYSTPEKRGAACYKTENGWVIDYKMPIIKGENRSYVNDRIGYKEEK